MKEGLKKKRILGIDVTDARQEEILEYIFNSVKNTQEKYYIVTPNPEIIMYATRHPEFKFKLNQARIALCDGVGLWAASQFLGKPLQARVTGVDLVEALCKKSVKESKEDVRNPITVGFLGAGPGVALKTAECLMRKYPGLRVVFAAEEYSPDGFSLSERFKDKNESDLQSQQPVTSNNNGIDFLFVAYGFPKQEEWMAEHIEELPVRVMIGVGGAFDYLSGNISRAPAFMRTVGFEWLYRLVRQPWRWRRQLALINFVFLVVKERLKSDA